MEYNNCLAFGFFSLSEMSGTMVFDFFSEFFKIDAISCDKYSINEGEMSVFENKDIVDVISIFENTPVNKSIRFFGQMRGEGGVFDFDICVSCGRWGSGSYIPNMAGAIFYSCPDKKEHFSDLINERFDEILTPFLLVNPVFGEVEFCVGNENTPLNLKLRLPDVPNVSIYGPPYVEMFGEELIKSAPFESVRKIGAFYIAVANSRFLEKVSDERRLAIRQALGSDSFMANGKWRYKTGVSPDMDWSGCQ